jgi:hypothetical protein
MVVAVGKTVDLDIGEAYIVSVHRTFGIRLEYLHVVRIGYKRSHGGRL